MKQEEIDEALNDVREFLTCLEAMQEKTFTLKLEGRKGKYCGASLEINKPAGKGLNFTE